MNFTTRETKMIEQLRKYERQWRWARWMVLVMGTLSAGLCITFGFLLSGLIAESQAGNFDAQTVFLIMLLWTKCCFYLLFGTWCLATVCFKWRGDVNRMLLLKLLDAQSRVG
jgi:formate hydrogenlyase subunit 3/multisubunit Na+/H+ antiporter MnhD subunit